MNVGIDIDGVVLDFERVMRNYAELYDLLVLRKNGIINRNEFDYLKRYNWTKEERDAFIEKYLVYGTSQTPLMPGAKAGLEFLRTLGYRQISITARGKLNSNTIEAVKKRLAEEAIEFDGIIWRVSDKLVVCKEQNISVMIDDNPDTCEYLSKNGVRCLYFRDQDNRKLLEDQYLKEVNNWGEICRYFYALTPNNKNIEHSKILLP